MIQKLKWKFVLINMCFVFLILIFIFLGIFITTKQSLERMSTDTLRRVINEGVIKEEIIKDRPDKNLRDVHMPYFMVRLDDDGTILQIEGTLSNNYDESALSEIKDAAMANDAPVGTIPEYGLRYMKQADANGYKIACIDLSFETSTLTTLILNSVMIGVGCLVLFFLISLYLSIRAIRPIEKSWKQQRQFIADASHELKTPLTVILANSQMMREQTGLSSKEEMCVEHIHAEAVRMKKLVASLLSLARIDAREDAKPVMERVSLSDLALRTLLLFDPVLFEQGKTITQSVDNAAYVLGNEEQLQQLLEILLDNAVKYTPKGGNIHVELTQVSKKHVRLSVANPGEVIPEEMLSKLFDRFFRLDPARQEGGGFGLGLSIAKGIVQAHGGTIGAESSVQNGNVFFIELPLAN
ncbi:MAG: sensor histidine kinase [Christensenellales bacterium]